MDAINYYVFDHFEKLIDAVLGPKENKEKEIMAGTKGKKQKGTIVDRTVRRLDRMHAYPNMEKRVQRWIGDETSVVAKTKLEELQKMLTGAATLHSSILTTFKELQAGKYAPPKKHFSGTIKLDVGKHVWIKPQYKGPYAMTYDEVILGDLHVSAVVDNKVQLSLGNPENNVKTMKILVSKSILQANAPDVTEAAA